MIKNELKLYFKSKINLLMLIFMTLPVVLSYFATNNERLEWQEQLQGAAADLNLGKVREIVDGYSGISYIFNFLFSSDYFIIFFLITLMGFSCVFGAELYNKNKSGFGNLTVVRMGYSKYLNCTLLSQAIYIACFFCSYIFYS